MRQGFELVFRNPAFVVSTILRRFSLAVQKPYDVELGLGGTSAGPLQSSSVRIRSARLTISCP